MVITYLIHWFYAFFQISFNILIPVYFFFSKNSSSDSLGIDGAGIGYMEVIAALMNKIDSWIWGLPMLVLLCGTHIFMTFRTGFIQRKTLTGIRLSVTKDPDSPGDVSQFQALTTALASTIGTGNIIGVGTAFSTGAQGKR